VMTLVIGERNIDRPLNWLPFCFHKKPPDNDLQDAL